MTSILRATLVLLTALHITSLPTLAASEPPHQHRAVRLGHPISRFAPPLKTPEDLRRTLGSDKLREDISYIAKESGFTGDIEDLRRAAASAPIQALEISVGTLLPAMSTRKQGKPVLLKDVLWAGKQPIDAYEFHFNSQGRRYRVVTPKACSNFWVEPQAQPQLVLSCEAPAEALLGQPVRVCQQVRNAGPGLETAATLTLPAPTGASPVEADADAALATEQIAWTLRNLPSGAHQQACALFTARQRGVLAFDAQLTGDLSAAQASHCETRIKGIPGVLLEVVDVKDPILVGGEVQYVIRVLNQGSEPLTQLHLEGRLEPGQRFISGSGASQVQANAGGFTLSPLAVLAPQQEARWQVAVKAEQAGDFRLKVEMRVDQMPRPVEETEATLQY